jgi:hypothetical protein
LSEPEKIAQRYALQLSTEHHVGAALYSEASKLSVSADWSRSLI